jgi:dTDP-4-amino-4,6-dideoxygalactose transaminase
MTRLRIELMAISQLQSKVRQSDLAFFGGSPLFSKTLHVGTPNYGDRSRLLERFNEILDARWFTNNGPFVQEFEARIATLLNVKHCIAVSSGTLGLELVLRACNLQGEVIVPSFTFVAVPHSVKWQGLTPIFCDIGQDNHLLDPAAVERLITPRTTAIIAVHTWGETCDVAALEALACKHHLRLFFDASHAFGCTHNGLPVGGFGSAEVFSLHATKYISTFEGGMITTNDDDLAAQTRLLRNFGFTGYDSVACLGINGKLNEMSAAMGLTNLEAMDSFTTVNYNNYLVYRDCLSAIPGVKLLPPDPSEKRNHQYCVVEVDSAQAGITRDQLMSILQAEGILARRYFYPGCHLMPPYLHDSRHTPRPLPRTEMICATVLVLPTGPNVSVDQINAICQVIKLALQ